MAAQRDLLVVINSRGPKDFAEGISHVLARRKQLLMGEVDHASGGRIMGEVDHASGGRITEISYQIDSLGKICTLIGTAMPAKGKAKNHRTKRPGDTRGTHSLRLGRILTPKGWREHVEVPLEAAQDEARSAMLQRDDIEANRAFLEESRRLLSFLDLVERDFEKAVLVEQASGLRKVS